MTSKTLLSLFLLTASILAALPDTVVYVNFETINPNISVNTEVETAIDTSNHYETFNTFNNSSASYHVTVLKDQLEDWYVQVILPKWNVEDGAIYHFSMYAYGDKPIKVAVMHNDSDWTYKEGFSYNLINKWVRCSGEFTADTAGTGALILSIDIGANAGDYYFDDILIEKVGTIDSSNTWYNDADSRIEQIRKGNFTLSLVDSKGVAINDGDIILTQVKSDFNFGTAVTLDSLNVDDESWYRSSLTKLYNTITIENSFKWPDFEPVQGDLDTNTVNKYIDFASSNDLYIRGHVLAWGLEEFGFNTHWSRLGTDQFLVDAIKNRITTALTYYKGKIHEYDVWNEPFHEMSLFTRTQNILDKDNIWALMDSAFTWAHSADSTADLYLNEYSIVSAGQTETLIDLVTGMKERGVPITGIGAQCHFESNPIEPDLIKRRLDKLSELNLKIRVTEFDLGSPDEGVKLTADELNKEFVKFYTTIFSHPAVSGLMVWGFWDKNIWNSDPNNINQGSGIYNEDKSIKLAGESITDLLLNKWRTEYRETLSSTAISTNFRGFYGTYNITFIDKNSHTKVGQVHFSKDSLIQTAILRDSIVAISKSTAKKSNDFSILVDKLNRVIKVSGLSDNNQKVSFSIFDIQGRLIYREVTTINNGDNSFHLPSNLSSGVRLLSITGGGINIRRHLLME